LVISISWNMPLPGLIDLHLREHAFFPDLLIFISGKRSGWNSYATIQSWAGHT